jgi:hypothetical protein
MVATMRYGTYLWTIYKGETKPHAFSWLLWGIVTGIGTLAQFQLNGGPSAWALAFVSITCLMISVLSFFIGEKNYTKSDWFALIGCFVAITMWQATDNPMIARGIIILLADHSQILLKTRYGTACIIFFCWASLFSYIVRRP